MGNKWRSRVAALGEAAAGAYLQSKGWSVIERNWRSGRFGEIDLVLKEPSGTLVFVEVKTRRCSRFRSGFQESGFDSIDRRKQQKIVTTARSYLARMRYPAGQPCRFDALVVGFEDQHSLESLDLARLTIVHVESAF